jgi:hypothetical protein
MDEMLLFVNLRERHGGFGEFVKSVGVSLGYTVAVDILSWLQLQHRYHTERGLELRTNEICQAVRDLLDADQSLAKLFCITGEHLHFRPEVDASERQKVREFAEAGYKPTLRT